MNYILVFSGFFMGVILDIVLATHANKRKIKTRIFGLRVHHTLYGIIIIIFGIFFYRDFLWAFAAGIILSHTARLKRIVFVER